MVTNRHVYSCGIFLFFDFIESYFLQSDFYPGLRKIPRMYPYSGNQVPL